jgi:hypothetical protein
MIFYFLESGLEIISEQGWEPIPRLHHPSIPLFRAFISEQGTPMFKRVQGKECLAVAALFETTQVLPRIQ